MCSHSHTVYEKFFLLHRIVLYYFIANYTLRGGCCTVLIARFDVNPNKRRLSLLTLKQKYTKNIHSAQQKVICYDFCY